jgi:site-specific DNA-methyltransferase (adenine-specific)
MSTDEGDIVLDPFVGTGTTVIAAKRLGRSYIGFDIDEKYVKNAQFKLSKEKSNSKIGDIWVSWFLDGLTTIRDKDWEELSQHYFIPEPRNKVDHTAIKFIRTKEINSKSKNKSNKITIKSDKLLVT